MSSTTNSYEKHKEQARNRQAEQAKAGRDIGELPKVRNSRRKSRAKRSFKYFLETYFPEACYNEFSPAHLTLIEKVEQAVSGGKLYAFAMPRGSGKSFISMAACLWAALYGHTRFITLAAASSDKAMELLETIRTWVETKDTLLQDFPEVCYPVRKLERINHRARGQTYKFKPTRMTWNGDKIVFPTIPRARSSGGIISACGMKGSDIRGQLHAADDGQILRPDAVLVDDPLTREAAGSPTQCAKVLKILNGDLLGMAGPSRSISGLVACTIIEPNDAIEQLLDRDNYPEFQGDRVAMLGSWPSRMDLWDAYADLRLPALADGRDPEEANEFYAQNKEAMTSGASVYWADRYNKDLGEVDALQSAMNLYYRNKRAFHSEYQNNPQSEDQGVELVSTTDILAKTSGLKAWVVEEGCDRWVAHIDVQGNLLYYTVVGGSKSMTASVVAYGTWPEQTARYFTNENAGRGLSDLYPGLSSEKKIKRGLEDLIGWLRQQQVVDSAAHQLELRGIGVDANWGESTDIVYDVCAKAQDLWPMHGRYVGASSLPFMDRQKKRRDILSNHFHIPYATRNQPCRHVAYDTNYWKTWVMRRWLADPQDEGSWSVYGDPHTNHEMFADHMTSEYGVEVTARGRTVVEYKLRPGGQNHWFDNVVASAVLLSMSGAALPDQRRAKPVDAAKQQKPQLKLSDLQQSRKKRS